MKPQILNEAREALKPYHGGACIGQSRPSRQGGGLFKGNEASDFEAREALKPYHGGACIGQAKQVGGLFKGNEASDFE